MAHRVVDADVAYYVLGELSVVAALAAVWATARTILNTMGRWWPFSSSTACNTAAKFNHDVVQLPFWALAGYAFRSGLHTGALVPRLGIAQMHKPGCCLRPPGFSQVTA